VLVVRAGGDGMTEALWRPWNCGGYARCEADGPGARCRRRAEHEGLHVAWSPSRSTQRWSWGSEAGYAWARLAATAEAGASATRDLAGLPDFYALFAAASLSGRSAIVPAGMVLDALLSYGERA
jgi:hypothetical protein